MPELTTAKSIIEWLKAGNVYEQAQSIVEVRYGASFVGVVLPDNVPGSRQPHLTRARAELASFLKDHFKLSYPALGQLFNRDHTTMMALTKKHEKSTDEKENEREKLVEEIATWLETGTSRAIANAVRSKFSRR